MSKNILLVDHSDEDRLYYTHQLKKIDNGLQFFYAGSAREAMKLLKRQKIDIVFIQKDLPVVNGLLLLSAIKYISRLRKAKIYIYSEVIDEGCSSIAQMLGASGCIEKKTDESVTQRELKGILNPGLMAKYVFFRKDESTALGKFIIETRGAIPD